MAVREVVTSRVGHLDAEGVAAGQECEAEVAAGDAAVGGGVRAEFGDNVRGPVGNAVRQVPGAQPLRGEEAREAGSAWGA